MLLALLQVKESMQRRGTQKWLSESQNYHRHHQGPCSEPRILCPLFHWIWKVLKFHFFFLMLKTISDPWKAATCMKKHCYFLPCSLGITIYLIVWTQFNHFMRQQRNSVWHMLFITHIFSLLRLLNCFFCSIYYFHFINTVVNIEITPNL